MSLVNRIRDWWRVRNGRDETPLDGETPFWLLSFVFHLALLVALASIFIRTPERTELAMVIPPVQDISLETELPHIEFNIEESIDFGIQEADRMETALAVSPNLDELIDVSEDYQLTPADFGEIPFDEYVPQPIAIETRRVPVRGQTGFAATGADGAIDRITQEILLSLEERPTLVIWLFDQSASMLRQRAEIIERFQTIYGELDQLEAANADAFRMRNEEHPLLTQVYAFGLRHGRLLEQPTSDVETIKQVVRDIPVDESGVENVFGAIYSAADQYKHLRRLNRRTGDRDRNVMIVVVSDEAGDDYERLEDAVQICKRHEMPVYVIGVPAPFGRKVTYLKWVDPNPNYDQTPQWAPVDQGPETLMPERLRLNFSTRAEEEVPIDSGFGPFGLTRLCYETGGIYFTVHPNRNASGFVRGFEIEEFTARFEKFFDPQVMRRYRPDYVSADQYMALIRQNRVRMALVQAAQQSWVSAMQPPRLRFPKFDEARFVNEVSRAQQAAALLEPRINQLYEILLTGEADRANEVVPRWQAGYDLAMGRVLAVKIRAESYNRLLAMLKTTLHFENPENNVWVIRPADTILTGSANERLAEKARLYLQRVVDEHPSTPWAHLAARELATPIGWELSETYQEPPRPRDQANNRNRNRQAESGDQPQQPPRRSPPNL